MRKLKKYTPHRFMTNGSHYDKDAADYAVSFIEALSHTKVPGQVCPSSLSTGRKQIVRDVFGVIKPNGYTPV
jgi:hypothetical protein